MFISRIFILIKIFLTLCQAQEDRSLLAKICHDNSDDVCVGVYVRKQWILTSSICKHILDEDALVITGSLQRECSTGKSSKILRRYELSRVQNIYLLKIEAPLQYKEVSISLEGNFKRDTCGTYCFQGTSDICKKIIEPIPTTIVSCKDEDGAKDNICLNIDNTNINGSPMLCNGTLIGFVNLISLKNFLTLVNISRFNSEVNNIIAMDAKIITQIQPNANVAKMKTTDTKELQKNSSTTFKAYKIKHNNIHKRIRRSVHGEINMNDLDPYFVTKDMVHLSKEIVILLDSTFKSRGSKQQRLAKTISRGINKALLDAQFDLESIINNPSRSNSKNKSRNKNNNGRSLNFKTKKRKKQYGLD